MAAASSGRQRSDKRAAPDSAKPKELVPTGLTPFTAFQVFMLRRHGVHGGITQSFGR